MLSVLLAETDPTDREPLVFMARRLGWQVETVNDGVALLERTAQRPGEGRPPDALLAERQRSLEAGMPNFLTKPLDPDALVRTARKHIELARSQPLDLAQHELARRARPCGRGWDRANACSGARAWMSWTLPKPWTCCRACWQRKPLHRTNPQTRPRKDWMV